MLISVHSHSVTPTHKKSLCSSPYTLTQSHQHTRTVCAHLRTLSLSPDSSTSERKARRPKWPTKSRWAVNCSTVTRSHLAITKFCLDFRPQSPLTRPGFETTQHALRAPMSSTYFSHLRGVGSTNSRTANGGGESAKSSITQPCRHLAHVCIMVLWRPRNWENILSVQSGQVRCLNRYHLGADCLILLKCGRLVHYGSAKRSRPRH